MAFKDRSAGLIGKLVKIIRNFYIKKGTYTEEEARELIIPGKLMDYGIPLAKPFIGVIRAATEYIPMTINGNITRYIPDNPNETLSGEVQGSIIMKNKIRMNSALQVLLYSENILDIENLTDELSFMFIGFRNILENELGIQFTTFPSVSEPNYLEDNKKIWSTAITLPFEKHFDYNIEMKKDVLNSYMFQPGV